jgi:hypothetical protein
VIGQAGSEPVDSSDKFIFGKNFVHEKIADFKPVITEIDRTPADIQHLLEAAHDTNAMSSSTRTTRARCHTTKAILISLRAGAAAAVERFQRFVQPNPS